MRSLLRRATASVGALLITGLMTGLLTLALFGLTACAVEVEDEPDDLTEPAVVDDAADEHEPIATLPETGTTSTKPKLIELTVMNASDEDRAWILTDELATEKLLQTWKFMVESPALVEGIDLVLTLNRQGEDPEEIHRVALREIESLGFGVIVGIYPRGAVEYGNADKLRVVISPEDVRADLQSPQALEIDNPMQGLQVAFLPDALQLPDGRSLLLAADKDDYAGAEGRAIVDNIEDSDLFFAFHIENIDPADTPAEIDELDEREPGDVDGTADNDGS